MSNAAAQSPAPQSFAPKSSVWVLIASESDAAIWTSENGASHLLRVIKQDAAKDDADKLRRDFAWQLMGELSRGALSGTCEGVILIACKDMLETLRRVMVPAIRRLMIAEIPGAPETISAIPTEPVSMLAWGTL
jgi:protein required for attachment to host cells